MEKKYYENNGSSFKWKDLGNISVGRRNLGPQMPVIVYRLLEYTTKDVLVRRFGSSVANDIVRECGYVAGAEFYKVIIEEDGLSFENFISKLQKSLKDYLIGILKIESADMDEKKIILTVAEDLDCSGLDITGDAVCNYDEGFIAGILDSFTGFKWNVAEIDCWATGDRVCRFVAEVGE